MKNDTDTIEINSSKTHASPEKYFALFDKYIPNTYNENSTVLLYDICNEGCIELIVNKNPDATYVVYDCQEMTDTLPLLISNVKFIFINNKYSNVELDKQFEYNLSGMKFDCIIMNPPYQRNLHLKILEKAIEHLKDDDSVCVNLSPVRWLQDPLAKYKKNSDLQKFNNTIINHIKNLDIVESAESNKLFQAGIMTNLGIYICKSNITHYKNVHNLNNIIDRIITSNITMLDNVVEYKQRDGWRWQISELQPLNAQSGEYKSYGWYRKFCIYNHLRSTIYYNGIKDNKDWTYYTSGVANDPSCSKPFPHSIKFNSETEAINFENSVKTTFYKYYVLNVKTDQHTPFKFLPWMGESINPRTGLKGYESEWTDEDFYTFFNITSEEQKIIEETMEKYK